MLKTELRSMKLSNREIEVMEQVAKGLTNKESAINLFVAEKTIKFHMTNIFRKLGFKHRAQLIVWCAEKNIDWSGGPKSSEPAPLNKPFDVTGLIVGKGGNA